MGFRKYQKKEQGTMNSSNNKNKNNNNLPALDPNLVLLHLHIVNHLFIPIKNIRTRLFDLQQQMKCTPLPLPLPPPGSGVLASPSQPTSTSQAPAPAPAPPPPPPAASASKRPPSANQPPSPPSSTSIVEGDFKSIQIPLSTLDPDDSKYTVVYDYPTGQARQDAEIALRRRAEQLAGQSPSLGECYSPLQFGI